MYNLWQKLLSYFFPWVHVRFGIEYEGSWQFRELVCLAKDRDYLVDYISSELLGWIVTFEASISNVAIDLDGPIWVNRPWISFPIPGLTLELPMTDVRIYLDGLERGPRQFAGRSFYILKGNTRWWIYIPPKYGKELIHAMHTRLPECEAAEFKEREIFSELGRHPNVLA